MHTIVTSYGEISVDFNLSLENPSIHIENSHKIKKRSAIKSMLGFIHSCPEYKRLRSLGYNRTLNSECREWRAHNFLYKIGYERERTAHTDIDAKESRWRRFLYAILSIF